MWKNSYLGVTKGRGGVVGGGVGWGVFGRD